MEMSILDTLRLIRDKKLYSNPEALALTGKDMLGQTVFSPRDPEEHLRAAMEWLCRAQDATPDDGVSRSYHLTWNYISGGKGWASSYPETTGYIIETFFDYADRTGDASYRERAIRMAQWESEVQMPSGAVRGGVMSSEPPTPAIFNTGQVILGWDRAYQETGLEKFRDSAFRASRFLAEALDEDGAWRKAASRFAFGDQNTYNARCAYALAQFYKTTEEKSFGEAAARNLDFVMTVQQENGWFESCCLVNNDAPLLHTIAYTIRGLLEGGLYLNQEKYIAAAKLAADALLDRIRPDGSLSACFDRNWNPAARFSCLTGDAQISIIWLKLEKLTGEKKYRQAAERTLRYLMKVQDLEHPNPGVRGGIRGSYPIWGWYGSYEWLNWACKFFADGLMLLKGKESRSN